MASTRTFRFIEAPPERSMRKKSPASAPRLYEWLVDNGYVEAVTTYSKRDRNSARNTNKARSGGLGGPSRSRKKKKRSPF